MGSQFGRTKRYGRDGQITEKLNAMIRLAFLFALACAFVAPARAQMSPSDMLTRIDHLEAQLRDLTGTVEQLQYRNRELEQEIQRLQNGAPAAAATPQQAPRPSAQYSPPPPAPYSPPPQTGPQYSPPPGAQYSPPPAAQPQYVPPPGPVIATAPAAGPSESEPSGTRRGDAFNPALNPTAPGAPRPLGTSTAATEPPPPVANSSPGSRQPGAPLDLSSAAPDAPSSGGNLPPPPPTNTNSTGGMQAALTPSNTPKDEFDLGYGYVQHKDYGLAEQTFRDFLKKYPGDRLTPEAQYWLGESLFQDKQYRDAAESFLSVSTKYDTTARAPDALLRLGQSLAALGEKEAACASLGEILRKYPRASVAVKQGVDREQKRTHC
jgi:tol-pal system protein YbgF